MVLRYLVFQRVQTLDYACPPRVWKKAGIELRAQSSEDVCRRQARQFIEAGQMVRQRVGRQRLSVARACCSSHRSSASVCARRSGSALLHLRVVQDSTTFYQGVADLQQHEFFSPVPHSE